MKLTNLLLAGVAGLALASCSSLDDNSTWGNSEVQFTSYIEGQKSVKATGSTWTSGDAIGIYMKSAGADLSAPLATNVKYTTDEKGNLTVASADEAIAYPETGKVDFVAYYPYSDATSAAAYSVSVADQSDQPAIDLLYSNNATSKSTSVDVINLGFTHKLSKVVFTVTPSNSSVSVAGLTATLKSLPTTATYDLSTATLTTDATTADIALKSSADGKTIEGILLPQSATGDVVIEFALNGKTVEATFPVTSLAAGTCYAIPVTLNITVDGSFAVSFGTATITDWTDVAGGEITVDFGDSGTVDPDPTPTPDPDPDPTPSTGEEVTLFEETFGTPAKSGSYWPNFDAYTGYTSGMTITDPYMGDSLSYSNGSIRSTSSLDGHAWFPATPNASSKVKDAYLKFEGFDTTGCTNLTLTYNIATQVAGTNQNVIAIYCDDTQIEVPSSVLSTANQYQTVTLTGLPTGFSSIMFVSSTTTGNTAGMRVDNIKLVGTK